MATPVTTTPTFASGTPRPVLDRSAYVFPNTARTYDVAPDGRLLVLKEALTANGQRQKPRVTVVLNWFEELKRRVPTN
jgi:hypothetical protein